MCNDRYPSIDEAHKIFYDYMADLSKIECDYPPESDTLHCMAVACNAALIASKCGMNGRHAYILGLLHDYGELTSRGKAGEFHGTSGYDAMIALGYPEIARICLTHTFPTHDFKIDDYTYPRKQLIRVKELISGIQYNEYDKIIQYSDALVMGYKVTDLKRRAIYIMKKYNVSLPAIRRKYKEFLQLKHYFDKKCGCDTYSILGIDYV